ncbi:hypothetical protein MAFF211271_32000 [Ralstonia syzygii subsp. indonesiensis]|nr:hypothetical protein MAFF211271_32000 [Ralstonia pseudosolanacearum]
MGADAAARAGPGAGQTWCRFVRETAHADRRALAVQVEGVAGKPGAWIDGPDRIRRAGILPGTASDANKRALPCRASQNPAFKRYSRHLSSHVIWG